MANPLRAAGTYLLLAQEVSSLVAPPPRRGGWGVVYTLDIFQEGRPVTTTAKLFKNGRSQAVRLPREFRFEGDEVRVRRAGRGVLLEPMFTDVSKWFAELDRLGSGPFMSEGRQQPSAPRRDDFDDDVPA